MPTTTKIENFFGLQAEYAQNDKSRAVLIAAPYENTVKGSKDAPKAIMDASQRMELFDDELWIEPYKIGVHTASPVKMAAVDENTETPFSELTGAVKPVVEMDKFPVIIGGERPITLGTLNACQDKYPDLSILMLGAHADLYTEAEGNPFDRSATGFTLYTNLKQPVIAQVGVRSVSWQEVAWMEDEQPNINIFWARTQAKWDLTEIINSLSDNVLLSIDMSVLDPSIMPATNSPEPGGIGWYQLLNLLKVLCVKKNVVAADITGLTPIKGIGAPNYLTAKLIYKLIGYRFAMDLGVSKKYL